MASTRSDTHRTRGLPTLTQGGFSVNPVAATIFLGLVLIVVTYSILGHTGAMTRLGRLGPLLPMLIISWLMIGIYLGAKRFKRRSTRFRIKGPLFVRSLMQDCLQRTCGLLETRLNTPESPSSMILNDILLDKMLHIYGTDCLRFSDIRRQIEGSRLKGTQGLELARFFQSPMDYRKQALPVEIRQVEDLVSRSRTDLKKPLERLKIAHHALHTGTGDILAHLPPDPQKSEKLRATYRYRPPTPERARRMVFALEILAYLKAIRHENVNPLDRRRFETVADRVIPDLARALDGYRQAWQDLVDAYERPQSERPE